jgi:hypothetical protein
MRRRSLLPVLLALLLLFTQQIGVTHVYTHWMAIEPSVAQFTRDDHVAHRKQEAFHKICKQCVSVAQMASVIHSPILTIAGTRATSHAVLEPIPQLSCERTTCVFQPRAPPLA